MTNLCGGMCPTSGVWGVRAPGHWSPVCCHLWARGSLHCYVSRVRGEQTEGYCHCFTGWAPLDTCTPHSWQYWDETRGVIGVFTNWSRRQTPVTGRGGRVHICTLSGPSWPAPAIINKYPGPPRIYCELWSVCHVHIVCRYLSRNVLTDVVTQCFVMFRKWGYYHH